MEASGGGKWAWSWMLPQPDTICQLPYSVEREEPERVCSAANLRGDGDVGVKERNGGQNIMSRRHFHKWMETKRANKPVLTHFSQNNSTNKQN